jgi:hypothetical protein
MRWIGLNLLKIQFEVLIFWNFERVKLRLYWLLNAFFLQNFCFSTFKNVYFNKYKIAHCSVFGWFFFAKFLYFYLQKCILQLINAIFIKTRVKVRLCLSYSGFEYFFLWMFIVNVNFNKFKQNGVLSHFK